MGFETPGVGPLKFSISYFAYNANNFLSTRGECSEVVFEFDLLWSIEGQTHFSTSWHAKMSLNPNEPSMNVRCSNLHTTSKHEPQNLPNVEGVVCKTTNS